MRITIWTADRRIRGGDRILRRVREFDRDDTSHREPFCPVPNRFARNGGDKARRAGGAQHSSQLAPIVAWSVAAMALGLVVGLAAVILPPLGAFGIVAGAAVVLLWVMPDLPLVSPGLIRKAFFVMLIVDVSIPFYYMVQFPGLPWISARRLASLCSSRPSSPPSQRRPTSVDILWSVFAPPDFWLFAPPDILPWPRYQFPRRHFRRNCFGCNRGRPDVICAFLAVIYIARGTDDVVFILKTYAFALYSIQRRDSVEFRLQHRSLGYFSEGHAIDAY